MSPQTAAGLRRQSSPAVCRAQPPSMVLAQQRWRWSGPDEKLYLGQAVDDVAVIQSTGVIDQRHAVSDETDLSQKRGKRDIREKLPAPCSLP